MVALGQAMIRRMHPPLASRRHINISAWQVSKTLFLHVTKRCGDRSKRVRTADASGRPDNKMRDSLSVCMSRVKMEWPSRGNVDESLNGDRPTLRTTLLRRPKRASN
jgi:hypothetical protein